MSEPREAQREAGKGLLKALGAGGAGQAGWSLARLIKTQIFGKNLLNLLKRSLEKAPLGKGREITLEASRGRQEVGGQLLGSMEAAQGMGGGMLWPEEAVGRCWGLRGGVVSIRRILGPWGQMLVADRNLCQKRNRDLQGERCL